MPSVTKAKYEVRDLPDLSSDKDVASETHFVWKTDAYLTRHQNNLMTE